jgi:hypothetical protein
MTSPESHCKEMRENTRTRKGHSQVDNAVTPHTRDKSLKADATKLSAEQNERFPMPFLKNSSNSRKETVKRRKGECGDR